MSAEDLDTASVVSQILTEILDACSSVESGPEPSLQPLFSQATCSNVQGDNPNIHPTAPSDSDKDEEIPTTSPFQPCTVKEIINQVLESTVIRRPSLLSPTTSQRNSRLVPEQGTPPPEYAQSTSSRMQCTMQEVLSEIMDYTVFKKTNRRQVALSEPGTSRTLSEQLDNTRAFEVYRALGAGIVNSANAIHDEAYIRTMLPSYSTVMRMGPPPCKLLAVRSSSSFIPKAPPPTYAQVEGIWENTLSIISSESVVFGPDPTYMICPRCRIAVVTEVEVRRSVMTHLAALFLCLCLCWPCCLMPYCLRSCNYTHHSCPHCSHYFGMYRPF